ncbi:MAG: response regulator [Lachnospiraceae bacterium]|nr:response regulator [Lachnospiraceae bacterium]
MYRIVLIIQIVSITVTLAECWVVFKSWKGVQHSYLFLACIATLVNNLGYYFQLRSHSVESYMSALRVSYAGRVWVAFALFMFVMELARIKVPNVARFFMALFNVITYLVVVTTNRTDLYYKITAFQVRDNFPLLAHTDGWYHHVWSAVNVLYALYALAVLFIYYSREKNKIAEKRYLMVMLAMATMSGFFVISILKPLSYNYLYDVTMLSFPIAAVFMFVAIFKYNLLDTATLARDYVIDRLSEAIIAVDDTGEISYTNEPAVSVFPKLISDPRSVMDTIRSAIDMEEPIRIRDRIYTPEANTLSDSGVSAGRIYTVVDDTQHYMYMEQLEEQKRMADEANRAKSSFLANMSHEIRTPINAVLGMDEMIIRESGEKNIRSYARDIKTAGRTLLSLINDILDFSKIEEGRMEIIPTQYDLSSVINDLVNMTRSRTEKKGLRFDLCVDRNVPHILYGDEIRIKQVALNLLTNAAKYTNEGHVGLNVGYRKKDDENIILSFEIDDSGIGMKEEDMDKLFSPFSRIDEKKNRSVEGTGLGMSIVRQLLDLMGSSLTVESKLGKGSKFSFEIEQKVIRWEPMGDISERFNKDGDENDVYRELFHAPDANILVVDDTEVNLSVFCNLLKQTKINIDTAASGLSALALAKDKHFDIIFIDHMMPDMDGIETLKRLQKETDCERTVCIALTANAVSGARQMYLQAGFSDYISKPVDGRRLEEMIRKYLPEEKVQKVSAPGSDQHVYTGSTRGAILVVDDDEVILETSKEILGRDFDVSGVASGEEAINAASKEHPDLILLDINLVGMNGFEVLDALKGKKDTTDIPVMFITADEDRDKEALGLKMGAIDFIRKPFIPEVLLQRSRRTIALDRYQKDLQGEVRLQSNRAKRLTMEMMVALSHTVDAKDHYTKGHSERVAAYAAEIGRRMGKTAEEQKQLYEIGLLHDIGKIGIPEEIINKTERLTDEEFAHIKEHTKIGCEILHGIVDMPELSLGARSHHERYDGSGYPDGLMRDAIPEVARIICVADCYDAMTSTRTYSNPKPQDKVRDEIERCAGSQFDPDIAAIMLTMIDEDKDYIMNERTGGSDVWKGYERIWRADDITENVHDLHEHESAGDDDELPDWLDDIEEIDVGSGIANCGSRSGFMSVLSVFHKTAGQKADEIRSLYEQNDIENYTIKVHALKSSARIIGASKLSDMAKDLEMAGKAGDTDAISAGTPPLLNAYRALDEKLSALDDDASPKKELTEQMRVEAFQTVSEIAKSMDYAMMENILHDLSGYALSSADRDRIRQMEDALMKLDWETIEAVAADVI